MDNKDKAKKAIQSLVRLNKHVDKIVLKTIEATLRWVDDYDWPEVKKALAEVKKPPVVEPVVIPVFKPGDRVRRKGAGERGQVYTVRVTFVHPHNGKTLVYLEGGGCLQVRCLPQNLELVPPAPTGDQ